MINKIKQNMDAGRPDKNVWSVRLISRQYFKRNLLKSGMIYIVD